MNEISTTQANWKDYFKPFIPTEEFKPDNASSNKLNSFIFFVTLGFITSLSLVVKVEGKFSDVNASNVLEPKIEKLKTQISMIESQNSIFESDILILNYNLTKLFESRERYELLRLSQLTGTHKSIGEGILIKLSDSNKPLRHGENPNLGLVHNTDLLNIINHLWAGGAKAISVNGIRIVNSSAITCIGPTLLINKTRIVPPFIIKAIGDSDSLQKSLSNSNIQILEMYGLKFSIERYDKLEIPANGNIILAGDNN